MNKPFTQKLIHIASLQNYKRTNLWLLVFAMLISSVFLNAQSPSLAKTAKPVSGMGKVSQQVSPDLEPTLKKYEKEIYFTENKGQWPLNVLYKADFTYGQAVATPNGMVMSSFDPASVGARSKWMMDQEEAKHEGRAFNTPMPALKGHAWMMEFVGASPGMKTSNRDAKGDLANYFIGNDPSKHATDVKSYNEVWYNNVYNNIDVRYYPSAEGALEYDIIARPGSDPSKIAIKFDGIDKLALNASGHLVLYTSVGEMDLPEPYVYQTVNGKEVKVEAAYALNAKNELTFVLGKYNTSLPLVIDPIAMRWATWMTQNSAADNHGHCVWVDASGNIYVVSRFSGTGLITVPGSFSTTNFGSLDLNVGKYTEPASVGGAGVRIWQTYLGGQEGDENPYVAEMGADGFYIAGYTTSNNFPVAASGTAYSGTGLNGALSEGGDNCFIIKINAAGNSIKGAVIGGGGEDDIYDMRITAAGDIILGGLTTSTDLSSNYSGSGASNTNNGSNDFWMFKVNQNLNSLLWMQNWGGSGADQINILNIKSSTGDIYAGGSTSSTLTHAGTPRQGTKVGGTVGYLMRANSSGARQWSSYFNSSGNASSSVNTTILCMEMNTAQTAFYFGGMTGGLATSNISSSGVYDNSQNGSRDFYVAKMALDQTFAYSTYIGSTQDEDNMMGLNVDANDDVYIFGYTNATGTNFPTAGNPLQSSSQGSRDKVFFKLETDLSALLYSTYYGGTADDSDPVGQRGIKFSNCRIYTIVTSESNNIPLTVGALNTSKASSTSIYEPAVIVWANPPDLGNNTISTNQFVCNGALAAGLTGPVPNYELPTITRNGTTSTYPALTTTISYQWQSSPDQTTWTDIPGATGQNLTAAQMGNHTQTTYYRRIFNGDACVLNNGNSFVTIAVFRLAGTVVNNTCFGGTAGTITTSVSGNSGTPAYVWSDGPVTTANRTGLAAGTYTVTATAPNGCQFSQTFTITQPNQIAFTLTPSNATCGSTNGSIVVSGVSGGSGSGYTYSRDGVTYQGGATFSGLAGGTYTIYVKDGNGCVRSQQVTVTSVNLLVASIQSQTPVLCFGGSTGSATITQSGGTANYTYSKDGVTFQSSNVFNGLAAGTYTITVKDANNCTATTTVTITQPASAVSVSISGTTNASCGGSNGSITAVGAGGTTAYTYSKDGVTFQSSGVFIGLAGGTYTITVKDANGCTATAQAVVGNNAGPSASIGSQVDVLCFGDLTGSVTINATGGTAPIQYSKDGVNFQLSPIFSGLGVGSFTVTVKDANNCTATVNITISQPASPLSASINSQTNVNCFGDATGSVSINAAGGTVGNGYQYKIGNGAYGLSNTFNGLAAGNYVVTVLDANGCTATVNVNITQPSAPLSASINNQVDVLCFGDATGSFVVNVTGGTQSYQYSINGGPFGSSNSFSGLGAGSYNVSILDAKGCRTSVSTTITQPQAPLSASIDSQTNVDCFGNASGSVSISAQGGTVGNGYQYQLGNGPVQLSNLFSGLSVGQYVVTIIDANNCSTTVNVNITQPQAPLSVSINGFDNVCPTFATGSATAAAAGGTANYSYTWNTVPTQSGPTATGLAAGTYTVSVVDANGCSTSTTVTISNNPKPNAGADFNICEKIAQLPAAGATESWSLASGPANASINSNGSVSGMNVGGTYMFILTNVYGCQDTALVVTTANCPLIANPDNATTNEDVAVNINVPSNDVDPDGNIDLGSVTIVDQPDNGTVVINNDGSIIYTPDANYNGPDSFIYNICDTGSPVYCDTALVTINVLPINDAPIANQDNASTTEDQPVTVFVPGNDTDVDGNLDNGSVTIVDQPNNGSVSIQPNGDVIYTPNPNFNGVDSLIYQICDTGLPVLCDTAYVIINVGEVNDAPIANLDTTSTLEDTPVTVFVPGNDTDVDGNLSNGSVTIVDQPNNGSVSVQPNGDIIYTPNPNFNGVDSLIYQICDTGLPILCDTAYVVINVTPVNDAPIANQDNTSTTEDQPVTVFVPGNDTDVDGNLDNSSVTIVDQPNNGSVSVQPNGDVIYTPNSNFNGVDSLIYQICDTGMPVLCDTAYVVINVTPVNDPPVANVDTVSTPEDSTVVIDVPVNDTDPDGNLDSTSVVVIDPPNHGTVVVDTTNGDITYTPNPNYNGPDTLIYQICDTGMPVLCDTALVIINVIPVNDPPVAVVDTAITNEDIPVDINVDINDFDVDGNLDTNSVVIITPPVNGNAQYNDTTGVIEYVPAPNFCGLDSLQYSIADSVGAMDSAWVYIIVQCVPDLTVDPNVFPSGTNISCFGANDGSIDLTIDSGTPPYTITWTGPNNFSSNDEDISGLAPGTYTVIVVDGNGNGDTASVTLTEPALLQHTLSAQIFTGGANISCAGSCDGAINLGITGGNAPYSILWTGPNGFTSIQEDIAALCGGTYYVSVVDLNGCAFTDSITLDQPDTLKALAVAATFVGGANVSCANACDGSIDLTISGGASPYTVAWTGPNNFSSASEDLSALCAGTYNVVVTDANGCTASYSITLTPPTPVDATLLPAAFVGGVNVSCANACDGAIDLSVSGGAAPYTFAWSGPSNFTSINEDIEALCAGTYTVIITDANGCTATESVTLVAPTPVAAAAVAATYVGGANVSCANACDGSINLTPSGGVGPYSYAWVGPNNFVAITEDLSGLCVGTYNVTVTDANGCTATTSVTLTAPQPVSLATISPVFNGGYNISCAGVCDGSISLTVSGGVAPFTYAWSGPNNFVAITEDLANLCAGTYTVIVTDANGCTATTSVTLTQPPVLNASIVAGTYAGGVNVTCANACDGFANLTVSGGTAPYTYSWTGPNFSSVSEDLTGLCAGTYNVTVTDANGCTATATVTLVAPVPVAAPAVAATYNGGVNVSCANACDGSINLSPSGGVAPYSFAWVGPNNFVAITEDISGLCPGTYTVIVADANGCIATTSVTIVAPQPISATAVTATYNGGFNVSCFGACDGSANLTVTGGTAPYTYSWTGGTGFSSTLEDVTGLCSGAYTVIVTDANGCTDTVTIDLGSPQPVSATSVVSNSTCSQPNGSVTLTPSGGDGNYNYAWVDGSGAPVGGNSPSLSGLAAGTYTATITDGNNCSATIVITISATPAASATFVPTNALCNSVCNGSISLALTTGTLPFTYDWSGPNSFSSNNESISGLCPGVYNVNIEDANGCTATYSYTITEPAAIAISVASNNAATCTANNGSASVVVIGGTGAYTYLWTGGSDSSSINNVAAGTYTIIVTDANGCVANDDVVIASQSSLALSTVATNANCNGQYCSIDLTVTGATNPVYAWSVPATTEDVDSLAPGTYVVFVTDDNGCTGIDTVTVTEPSAIVIASADILVYPNGYNVSGIIAEDGVIDLTVTGGAGSYIYEWSNGSSLEDQFNLAADTFNVTITDTAGCVLTEQYILEAPPLVELPTGFSPDGDGLNDFYIIHGIEKLNDNEFTVFNRWGQVIFNKKGYQNDWAGTNFQGNPMPDGTYFILFTVVIPNEGEKTFKATVEQRANFVK